MASVTTAFSLTESPISEGGRWLPNVVSATWTAPVHTVAGVCKGETSSAANDAVAFLAGSWGSEQRAQLIVNGAPSNAAELELHLCAVMLPASGGDPDRIQTYEIDFTPSLSNTVTVAKWLGPQGSVSVIGASANMLAAIADGDVLEAWIRGPAQQRLISVYQNGSLVTTVTDTSAGYMGGSPGIGFDAGTTGDGNTFNARGFFAWSPTPGDYSYYPRQFLASRFQGAQA